MAHYIATDPQRNAIHGVGPTAEAAIADACRAAQDPSAAEWLVPVEATEALVAQVEREGGDIRWTEHDGRADVADVHCECGEVFGEPCEWSGPIEETELVVWMPKQHRGAHAAARNSGRYPANGALRIRVEAECAERIREAEGDPDEWPDGCAWVESAE